VKVSTTLFLAFLLSGLGVYYFLAETPPPKTAGESEPIKILTLREGDSLSSLEIERADLKETISLRRRESGWMMEAPVSYPAENFLVQGMVDALAFSRRARRLPFKAALAKEFGFDAPEIKISVQSEKEPKRRSLLLGARSPVVAGVYAHWQGEDEYFLVSPDLKASFERTVYSLRQKKLFRSGAEEMIEIKVKMPEKEFRVQRKGDRWHWSEPALANEIPLEKASELVYAFQSLYVKEFLDGEDPAKKEWGLEPPQAFLAVKEKGGKEEKLLLGVPEGRKEALYALREREKLVVLVSEKKLRSLVTLFETTFFECQSDDQRETGSGSRKDRESRRPVPEKSG